MLKKFESIQSQKEHNEHLYEDVRTAVLTKILTSKKLDVEEATKALFAAKRAPQDPIIKYEIDQDADLSLIERIADRFDD